MATSRSTGPASRPPRRGSAARPASKAGSARSSTRSSTRSASASPRPSTTGTTTAKVVRRTPTGWRGQVGGAMSNRMVRRTAVLASIAIFLVVLLTSSVAAWLHQQGQIAALRDKVSSQEADVASLREERQRWEDPAYVEQQARQRLKFVRPGERAYTVLDPEATKDTGPATTGPGAGEATPALPWYDGVWQSVRTADAPGARR
ncbi:septum formation initiator family protein [Phycicoccus jejuensis]|uniref:FtsB family cell division protein n=1 Tax=Phycicoccus jejuensis TaxID=367299 RepID=UPI000A07BD41|nr:septum formation initiator family protein [Phycicoccus jejuensis]